MRLRILGCAALSALALCGCHKKDDAASPAGIDWSPHPRGRYIGAGVYSPGEAWTHLADVQQPNGPPKTAADQAIIVVVDSASGETRACGDLSGYCVGMNPWKTELTAAQKAPVVLAATPTAGAKTASTPVPATTPAKP